MGPVISYYHIPYCYGTTYPEDNTRKTLRFLYKNLKRLKGSYGCSKEKLIENGKKNHSFPKKILEKIEDNMPVFYRKSLIRLNKT